MAVGENKRVEDMNYFELLAWLGIGSSHPGGFPATKRNLECLQVKPEDHILDAGCGSGLTACHLAKTVGCKITGIDISPRMIEKAQQRAEKEGVTHLVSFKVADVYKLPFPANHFDMVMGESISVFLDKARIYREFYRVLKPGGRVADHEMALVHELSDALKVQLEECFGKGTNPLLFEHWLNAMQQAGFQEVQVQNAQPLKTNTNIIVQELKKDWLLIKNLSEKMKDQPGLLTRLQKNSNFIKKNQGYFGFGLFCGIKPVPEKKPGFKGWLQSVLIGK